MSDHRQDHEARAEAERQALREIARFILEVASRLPGDSALALNLTTAAEDSLLVTAVEA